MEEAIETKPMGDNKERVDSISDREDVLQDEDTNTKTREHLVCCLLSCVEQQAEFKRKREKISFKASCPCW